MKIDYRSNNPIKTYTPLDYSIYKNKKLNNNNNDNDYIQPTTAINRVNRSDEQFRQICKFF
ncbi:hypothetical protein DICPUDRAFT_157375 [Dictyostelium purpureum]|uniref:Uncharacterized protein n=1 Tax=Dictyostelium purpureum TaxID=5786 RepID=F0ZYZ3_DICPU|nr:uncharacterized protein DICPUDRAFT_157375 [Dictyostelium purpureum]EGC30828.1 hypothetical protein DICPUDRAFT_157375 [Dictyostelium purpureum]|eukprot:XP_003292642.1 hypothetical protein DICPUDRAFT_157375 [Dictyostelium purpureum]